jgi:hypothetical protein
MRDIKERKGTKKRHPLDEITKNYGLLWKVVELQCNDRMGVREEKIRISHYSAATVLEMDVFLLSQGSPPLGSVPGYRQDELFSVSIE